MCWLIRCKARVRIPGQATKLNMNKHISSVISFQQISSKNFEIKINLTWEKFCRSESMLNCRYMSSVGSYAVILTEGL